MVTTKGSRRRKSAADALFRQVANAAPLMVWTADAKGRLTFANRAWLTFAGRTAARERGLGWTTRIHPEDRAGVVNNHRAAVKDSRPFVLEYRYERADGQTRWISDRGVPQTNARGRIVGYVGARVDVTDRKSSTGALAEAEARFRQLAENAQDLVYRQRFVPDHATEFINAAALALTGRHPEEFYADPMLGRKCVHPDDAWKLKDVIDDPARVTPPLVLRWVHPDGKVVVLEHRRVPVFDETGAFVAIEGVARDITALVEHQQAMQRSEDQLRNLAANLHAAREAERAHLARELHDDLGQTLTSLKLELVRMIRAFDRNVLTPPTIDRIQSLIGLAEISLETTRRIATDLRPPALDHLGLSEAIRWEASLVEARTGIRCRSVLRAAEHQLPEDQATGVFRIFQEAMTNVVRHAEASAVKITLDTADRALVLSIRDNGRGITPDQAADPAAIGLVGMRERARLLGGTLDITGRQGKGTTVVFRLPEAPRSVSTQVAHAHSAR